MTKEKQIGQIESLVGCVWSRRRALQAMAVSGVSLLSGCRRGAGQLPPAGHIVGSARARGHELREGTISDRPVEVWDSAEVVIVGGGISGLASAWELQRRGIQNFVILELEDVVGGTSRGSQGPICAYPWGAHYLPVPQRDNESLLELLQEMGVVTGFDATGEPIFEEEALCRDPEERLFYDDRWHEDLVPAEISGDDRAEWDRFRHQIDEWVGWRDRKGKRAFAIPADTGSADDAMRSLDEMTMSQWLDRYEFNSPLVRWEVDYACRDDYGLTANQASAWAGLFYFASRVRMPGESPQALLTWPEGNARFVQHFSRGIEDRIRTSTLVVSIMNLEFGAEVRAVDFSSGRQIGWKARHVIFAGPQFVARRVVQDYDHRRGADVDEFTYAPWLVANLHLRDRPRNIGFEPAWDNVLRDSPGLGYVIATHQTGRDHGPTVLTYYRPLTEFSPRDGREWLERSDWGTCAELVLADLEQAHPDIRSLVDRLDVMHWGHAMIRPVPGFRFGSARARCAEAFGAVHFANTDLSGVALMEEAFHHGVRAANEIVRDVRVDFQSRRSIPA